MAKISPVNGLRITPFAVTAPDFFKPSNKQTKFKFFPKIKKTIKPNDVLIITAYDKPYRKIGNLFKKSLGFFEFPK